jgi:hypothetical protein
MTGKLSGKRKNIGNQWDDANKKITFAKRQKKNPDSSPVTESWERNARDCTAKVYKIWNITKNFLKKFSRLNVWSGISTSIQEIGPCHTSLPLQSAACRSILYQFVCVGSDAPQCALP